MNVAGVYLDAIGRVREVVHEVVEGLSTKQLAFRPGGEANSIAWLVWHLTRVQDDHVSQVADRQQAWTEQGWAGRFGLDLDPTATGYARQLGRGGEGEG